MKYERMKMLRKEKKFSQEKIAELIDVSMNHYGKYERGEIDIPLNKAMALCDIFDVSLDYLVGWSDNRYVDAFEFKQKFLEKMKKALDTIWKEIYDMIRPDEDVIAHFENNDTSENHELCAKCNGACCRHYAGAYGPWQLFDNPEDITPEAIANLLQQDEKYILDCYTGYSDEHPHGWFIRPPHKRRATWETLQLCMNVLGVACKRIYVDRSFGGECVHFVSGTGCKLAYGERPVMCQALVAKENRQCAGFDKKDAADWWSEYHHIIDEALELLNDE